MILRFTKAAEADLAAAFDWYEQKKPDLGYRFMARVEETLDLIASKPDLMAPRIGEARRVLVEQFPYAIWYVERPDGDLVIACIHGHRDVALVQSRLNEPEPQ